MNDFEQLLRRGETLDTGFQLLLRNIDLEKELLRRDVKKALKRLRKRRRIQLRCLAEVDQITAELRRKMEVRKEVQND